MSVVNKMLQDLETRQQQQQNSANYQPPAKRRHGWWMFGVLPLAVVAAVIYWFWPVLWSITEPDRPPQQTPQATQSSPETTAPSVSTDKQIEEAVTEPEEAEVINTITRQPELHAQAVADADDTVVQQETPALALPSEKQTTNKPVQTERSQPAVQTEKPVAFSKTQAASNAEQRWQQLKAEVSKAMADNTETEAISGLKKMLEIQPDNHQVRRKLAALLLKNGATAHSGLLLEQGVELYPQELSLLQSLARFYDHNQQTDKALMLLKGHNPNVLQYPDYIQLRARLAQKQQDHQQAQHDYALLSRYQPDNIKWRLGLAVSLDQGGQHQAAIEVYRWLDGASTPPQIGDFVQQRLMALGG
ncbi:hypothetical protein [Lacimicrobium alkaliphilum]|uniref:MSHA biogenesis protein MshN n=1 Tax=Lacimicrobium alkaliphilum TaxID=1526571 RepID=A0ABQ1RBN2_9ALTE|nr:hypothetical protein [Lacimicrobium alkaliphilum]GGD61858.1 hypothetical protein GCM10011357_16420 [Lacimicrobium alkaliphilum]